MTDPDSTVEALAAGSIDRDDLAALERIARLYDTLDPMPAALVDRVQFTLTLDALHAEIAELQRSGDLLGVRGDASDAQTVTFTSSAFTTMVTITALSAETVRIDGWVVPGAGVHVDLRTIGETISVQADADGRFVIETAPRGMAQFVLRADGATEPAVVTPSIEL